MSDLLAKIRDIAFGRGLSNDDIAMRIRDLLRDEQDLREDDRWQEMFQAERDHERFKADPL